MQKKFRGYEFQKITLLVVAALMSAGCDKTKEASSSEQPSQTRSQMVSAQMPGKGKAAVMSGGDLLMKAEKAYRSLDSYQGTIEVFDSGKYENTLHHETRKYRIFYQRPGKLRFEGNDSNGDPVVIVTDGKTVQEDDIAVRMGKAAPAKTIREALAGQMGVSLQASVLLPSFLLGIEWNAENIFLPQGRLLPSFAQNAKRNGSARVDGHACHRVECHRSLCSWVFYIDKKNYLIRQIEQSESPQQMERQRRLGLGGYSGRIISAKARHIFHIQSVNTPLDASLFKVRQSGPANE